MLDDRYLVQLHAHKNYVASRASSIDKEKYIRAMDIFSDKLITHSGNSKEAFMALSTIYLEVKRNLQDKKSLEALNTAYEQVREIILNLKKFELD